MKIYYYDESGNFTGEGESHTLPEGATKKAPPGDGYLFNGDEWVAKEVLKPTPEQQLEIDIRVLKQKREQALSELTYTFEDGSVIQVRPSDIPVLQLAISVGQDEDWVMANDTVRTVTVEEMQQAMNSGIVQAKAVWNDYTSKLKLLAV